MYVDPFWAGVVATILAEVAVIIGIGLFNMKKK